MRSQGTKETQGINGDAASLQHQLAAAMKATASTGAPCPYEEHRGEGWRLGPEHKTICGVCHPPAAGLTVELVA